MSCDGRLVLQPEFVGGLHELGGFDYAGVDMIDATPILDIKPWVAPLDVPPGHTVAPPIRNGWFDTADLSGPHTPASLRTGVAPTPRK